MFDLVVVFGDGGLDLFDAQPDAERLLLHGVLLLLQDLYLLQHPLILLLHLRESGLQDKRYTWYSTSARVYAGMLKLHLIPFNAFFKTISIHLKTSSSQQSLNF